MPDDFDQLPEYDPGTNDLEQGDQGFFSPPEPSDEYIPATLSVSGGIDALRNREEKAIAALEKQAAIKPIYRYGDEFSYVPPDPSRINKFIDIRGNETYQGNISFVPYQQEQADVIRQKLNRLTLPDGTPLDNMAIYQKRGDIYRQLLAGNDGKPMDVNSFLTNPYFDQFQGMDNDTLAATKSAIWRSIQPQIKNDLKIAHYDQVFSKATEDPVTKMFLDNMFPEEFRNQFRGSNVGYKAINEAKGKRDLFNDPDYQDAIKAMKDSDDPRDRRMIDKILRTPTANGMQGILDKYMSSEETKKQQREKSVTDFLNETTELRGPVGQMYKDNVVDAINKKQITGAEAMRITRELSREWGDDNGMVQVYFGPKDVRLMPSLAPIVAESKTYNYLQAHPEEHDRLYITLKGTVVNEEDKDRFTQSHLKEIFKGDYLPGAKTPGEYIRVDRDKFEEMNGNRVVPSLPAPDQLGFGVVSPVAYEDNNYIYLKREYAKQKGWTEEQLASEDKITIQQANQAAQRGMDIPVPFMPAKTFMSAPEGFRLQAEKEFFNEFKRNQKRITTLADQILPQVDLRDPSAMGEMGNAIARTFGKAAYQTIAAPVAIVNDAYNGIMATWKRFNGEDDSEYINKLMESGEGVGFATLAARTDELSKEGGALAKYNANPNATDLQKWMGFGAGLISDLAVTLLPLNVIGKARVALTAPIRASKAFQSVASSINRIRTIGKIAETEAGAAGQTAKMSELMSSQGHFANMVGMGVDMTMLSILQGHMEEEDLTNSALYGVLFGAAGGVGKGLFQKGPWSQFVKRSLASGAAITIPEAAKLAAAKWATTGEPGMDTLHNMLVGDKTYDEMVENIKNPETLAQLAAFFTLNLLGKNHRLETLEAMRAAKAKAGEPATPATPAAGAVPKVPVPTEPKPAVEAPKGEKSVEAVKPTEEAPKPVVEPEKPTVEAETAPTETLPRYNPDTHIAANHTEKAQRLAAIESGEPEIASGEKEALIKAASEPNENLPPAVMEKERADVEATNKRASEMTQSQAEEVIEKHKEEVSNTSPEEKVKINVKNAQDVAAASIVLAKAAGKMKTEVKAEGKPEPVIESKPESKILEKENVDPEMDKKTFENVDSKKEMDKLQEEYKNQGCVVKKRRIRRKA